MLDIALTSAVAAILVVWFVLTILHHLPFRLFDEIRASDSLRLLPRWNFFAPEPGVSDFHLLFRDHLVDESVTPWQKFKIERTQRSLVSWLWQPNKRVPKAVFDLGTSLLSVVTDSTKAPEMVPFSLPYLMFLNAVSSMPKSPFTVSRQFVLVKTDGVSAPPDVLFISHVHEL